LGHLLPVLLGVHGGLGEETGVLLGGHSELVEETMMPDSLHIVPGSDHSMLDGILQGQHTPLGLGLLADEGFLLVHTHHDAGHLGSSDNGGE